MRIRVLLAASTTALVAASCAQTEPQILSEASRSDSATALTSAAQPTERDSQPGRFIARCATEADGGTPGMTFFTDGSQNVTDHCLSRYYIGVQPAPGALYVADEDAGTYAPPRPTQAETTADQWTPAQPRTDLDAPTTEPGDPDDLELAGDEQDEDGSDLGDGVDEGTEGDETTTPEAPDTDSPVTPPTEETPPTSPTTPGETDPDTPGITDPSSPDEDAPAAPGSSEPAPETDPATTGTAEAQPSAQSSPLPPFGSSVPDGSAGPQGSEGLPSLPLSVPAR